MAVLARATRGVGRGWLGPSVVWLAVAVLVASCQTVFDGELGTIACTQEGSYGPPACPEMHRCQAGACVNIGVPLGEPCGTGPSCEAGAFCFDPATIGAAGVARCTRSCCASTDCGLARDGQVCWSPSGGAGSLCWPAAALGREQPGEGAAGEPCGPGGACRSGLCDVDECVDVCCDDSYCRSDGDLCRVKPTPLADSPVWACGAPPDQNTVAACDSDDDCLTGSSWFLPRPRPSPCFAPDIGRRIIPAYRRDRKKARQ